ncbi:MAG: hypothetical protein ACREUJ_01075 [Burkholderiales bacterium]
MACNFWGTTGATIVSVLIGAAVTWLVAWCYYKRAGDELRGEAAELRKLMTMMLIAMERQGWAKLNRDAAGNITGFIFEHVAEGGLSYHGSLDTKFIPGKPSNKPDNDA